LQIIIFHYFIIKDILKHCFLLYFLKNICAVFYKSENICLQISQNLKLLERQNEYA